MHLGIKVRRMARDVKKEVKS